VHEVEGGPRERKRRVDFEPLKKKKGATPVPL